MGIARRPGGGAGVMHPGRETGEGHQVALETGPKAEEGQPQGRPFRAQVRFSLVISPFQVRPVNTPAGISNQCRSAPPCPPNTMPSRHISLVLCRPHIGFAAAAAAKSLQLCPTLCDPIDGSPPGFPISGILQARTLERVAISFSNA